MPRFRRSFRRRPRRRTRWLSVIPGSRTFSVNNEYAFNQILLQASGPGGATPFSQVQLVGATILRTILDIVVEPTKLQPSGPSTGWAFVHSGLFVSAEVSPNNAIWDPNVPSGEFFARGSFYHKWWFMQEAVSDSIAMDSMTAVVGPDQPYGGHVIHFDTKQRRKIDENEGMFVSWRAFMDDAITPEIVVGYTGRVLLALP